MVNMLNKNHPINPSITQIYLAKPSVGIFPNPKSYELVETQGQSINQAKYKSCH